MILLRLPNGGVVVDEDWHTMSDVMKSFHAFGVDRVYGQLETEDGVALTPMVPYPPVDGWQV